MLKVALSYRSSAKKAMFLLILTKLIWIDRVYVIRIGNSATWCDR